MRTPLFTPLHGVKLMLVCFCTLHQLNQYQKNHKYVFWRQKMFVPHHLPVVLFRICPCQMLQMCKDWYCQLDFWQFWAFSREKCLVWKWCFLVWAPLWLPWSPLGHIGLTGCQLWALNSCSEPGPAAMKLRCSTANMGEYTWCCLGLVFQSAVELAFLKLYLNWWHKEVFGYSMAEIRVCAGRLEIRVQDQFLKVQSAEWRTGGILLSQWKSVTFNKCLCHLQPITSVPPGTQEKLLNFKKEFAEAK